MTILAAVLFTVIYLISFLGVLLPVLPGVPLAALGALLAGWLTGFERLGLEPLLIVVVLAILSQLVDLAASYFGAKVYGARQPGLWGGVFGSLVGLVFFPPFGFLLGAMIGAVVAELLTGRKLAEAIRAGLGALLGTLGGVIAKLMLLIAIGVVVFPRLFG